MSQTLNISSRRSSSRPVRVRSVRAPTFTRKFRRRPNTFAIVPRPMPRAKLTAELKFFDTSFAQASTVTWVVISQNLCVPTQGQGNQNRIGSKITIRSLNFRMFLSSNAVESQTTPTPQIMSRVFVGINVGGGTVTNTSVMDTGATSQLLSWRNVDHTEDHTMIKDFRILVKPSDMNEGSANLFAAGTTISEVVSWTKVWPKGLSLKFVTGADTLARNGLFMMFVSTATGAVLNVETRCRYTDG